MTRLFVVAFFGKARTPSAEHPHESPAVMTVPLVILALLSFVGGFIGIKGFYLDWSSSVTDNIGWQPSGPFSDAGFILESIVPAGVVILGVFFAWLLYWGRDTDPLDIPVLAHKFYFDEFYDRSLVEGQQMTARLFNWVDSWILEGLIIRGGAYLSAGIGELLRLFQTGSLQGYAFIFTLGSIILIYFTLFAH
jgi:NADH-quinone oxidoreductase subunit L